MQTAHSFISASPDLPLPWLQTAAAKAPATAKPPPSPAPTATEKANNAFWGEDGFTFGDLVDIVNPLQHIPGISTAYREASQDDLSRGARIIGDALFGGPIGFMVSLINSAVEEHTGQDIGEHVVAWFKENDAAPAAASAVSPPVAAESEPIQLAAREQEMLSQWVTVQEQQQEDSMAWHNTALPLAQQASLQTEEAQDRQIMHPLTEFIDSYRSRQWSHLSTAAAHDTDLKV